MQTLTGREFKLLLSADTFAQKPSLADANDFWNKRLRPIIEAKLGPANVLTAFDEDEKRIVSFWDTADCMLTKAALNLRLRQKIPKPGEPKKPDKVTLKLRKGASERDHVASRDMPATDAAPEDTKFEEDIGPGGSKFALSTTATFDWGSGAHTIDELNNRFKTIRALAAASNLASYGLPLQSGPEVREVVFKGASALIEKDVTAKFDLTIWEIKSTPPKRIAEISFSYKVAMETEAGRQLAIALFGELTNGLHDLAAAQPSKTALALPNLCATV